MERWKKVINLVFFKCLWLTSVLGAAHGIVWPGALVLLLFIGWQTRPSNSARGDGKLLVLCGVAGFIIDSIWVQLGIINFSVPFPIAGFAPLWIVMLWLGIALLLNHSLAWLKDKPLWAVCCGAVTGPLSYFAGARLGAAQVMIGMLPFILVFAATWACIVPGLAWIARVWSEDAEKVIEQ